MQCCKLGLAALGVGAALCLSASTALGLMIMPQPGPARVMNSDVVLVGKVTALEPQDVTVMNVKYRIAVVKVRDVVRGNKALTTVRVGFIAAPSAPPAVKPAVGKGPILLRPGIRFRGVQLQANQNGLFLLKKHATENFYTLNGPTGSFISSDNNPNFDRELGVAKAIVKAGADPRKALKSPDPEQKLLGAAILIEQYRKFTGRGAPKQQPIDAEESKQILLALANADWNGQGNVAGLVPNPATLFYRLGITQKDGWMPPRNVDQRAAIPAWLRDNYARYRVQRFVAGDAK
jgi:hypothetical protein